MNRRRDPKRNGGFSLVEVSIAFAGFSGVVGVFGGGSALSEAERTLRVRMMITASLAAFFGLPYMAGAATFATGSGLLMALVTLKAKQRAEESI